MPSGNWMAGAGISAETRSMDEDGFRTIADRYPRFAKIGGEMLSLGAVEQQIASLFPEEEAVEMPATSVPDEQKGERILLLVAGEINPDSVLARLKQSPINPLMRPAKIPPVDQIPKLGSGKTIIAVPAPSPSRQRADNRLGRADLMRYNRKNPPAPVHASVVVTGLLMANDIQAFNFLLIGDA